MQGRQQEKWMGDKTPNKTQSVTHKHMQTASETLIDRMTDGCTQCLTDTADRT